MILKFSTESELDKQFISTFCVPRIFWLQGFFQTSFEGKLNTKYDCLSKCTLYVLFDDLYLFIYLFDDLYLMLASYTMLELDAYCWLKKATQPKFFELSFIQGIY